MTIPSDPTSDGARGGGGDDKSYPPQNVLAEQEEEQDVEGISGSWSQFIQLAHMPPRRTQLLGNSMPQQDAFNDIHAGVSPRADVVLKFRFKQPVVQVGLVLLVVEIGLHDVTEEIGIFVHQEEVQFVAGVL